MNYTGDENYLPGKPIKNLSVNVNGSHDVATRIEGRMLNYGGLSLANVYYIDYTRWLWLKSFISLSSLFPLTRETKQGSTTQLM